MSLFNFLITTPLTNLVIGFYQILGENLGLAIIFFTICLRIALLPLTIRQIRTQKKMAELQPRLQELQANRKDPSQMTAEEMMLMRQTASSCLGGCLPLLIQIPILIGLNQVISRIASATSGDIFNNTLYFDSLKHAADYKFHTQFLGIDLAQIPSQVGLSNPAFIPFGIIIVLLVVTQFLQGKMMNLYQRRKKVAPKKKANERKVSKEEEEKKKMQEDMQKMMQLQTTYLIPFAIGMASYSFNAALGIYWLTQNLFAIGQVYIQNNYVDGKVVWKNPFRSDDGNNKSEKVVKEREVKFEDISASTPSKKKKKNKKKRK